MGRILKLKLGLIYFVNYVLFRQEVSYITCKSKCNDEIESNGYRVCYIFNVENKKCYGFVRDRT